MRLLLLNILVLSASLPAGEPTPAYPLWDGQESVADYAKRVNLAPTQTLDLGNGVKMELVLIPAGQFIMGTPEPAPVDEGGFRKKIVTGQALLAVSSVALLVMVVVVVIRAVRKKRRPQISLRLLLLVTVAAGGAVLSSVHWRQSARGLEAARVENAAAWVRFRIADDYDGAFHNEKPAHTVLLTNPIYMGKYVVTQDQFQTIIGSNPSHFKGKDNPVETVSWDDTQTFCKKLTEQTKLAVRVATEAEWEFACRAGTTTTYYSGDRDSDLARVAWHDANSKGTTHPVGRKEPNAFGLYDMHGNVGQWCQDFYKLYEKSEAENPQGPSYSAWHVMRGGSWDVPPFFCRSAFRFWREPGYHVENNGFRIVTPIP